jgi:GTPase SAR1 family protein
MPFLAWPFGRPPFAIATFSPFLFFFRARARSSVGATNAQLSVWDTAGQERFHALGPIYYRDADGALLV